MEKEKIMIELERQPDGTIKVDLRTAPETNLVDAIGCVSSADQLLRKFLMNKTVVEGYRYPLTEAQSNQVLTWTVGDVTGIKSDSDVLSIVHKN